MRRRTWVATVLAPLLVIAAALAGGAWATGRGGDARSSLTGALGALPSDTEAVGFTDWSLVRRHLGVDSVSTAATRSRLGSDATVRDLSTRSALGDVIEEMHDLYGWSAADLDWEAYGQAPGGAAMVGRLDGVSFASVRSHLRALGYTHDGAVWNLDPRSPKAPGPELSSTLAAVALVPSQHLVVAASDDAYARSVVSVVERRAPSLLDVRPAVDTASTLVGVDAAYLTVGALVCKPAGFANTSADVEAQARAAVDRVGSLAAPTYAGRGIEDVSRTRQVLRFSMGFRSPAQAAGQLRARVALASGPFIGRTGRIEDSLDLTRSSVEGSTVALRFDHDPDSTVYMTAEGPLLFAGCEP